MVGGGSGRAVRDVTVRRAVGGRGSSLRARVQELSAEGRGEVGAQVVAGARLERKGMGEGGRERVLQDRKAVSRPGLAWSSPISLVSRSYTADVQCPGLSQALRHTSHHIKPHHTCSARRSPIMASMVYVRLAPAWQRAAATQPHTRARVREALKAVWLHRQPSSCEACKSCGCIASPRVVRPVRAVAASPALEL
jgi:hypothetical protein